MYTNSLTTGSYLVPDLLAVDLRLVFCGTAPSTRSAAEKSYYAKPGNRFWPTLYQTGITPRLLVPSEYPALLSLGIGLTDLCKDYCGTDAQLPDNAFDGDALLAKIDQYRPRIVAFTSKNAGREVLGRQPEYGFQPEPIGSKGTTRLFVLPSPSGLATKFFDIRVWQLLADTITGRVDG
ncbi:MAG: mismatch-specific DNA-glycosylase [Burkholderiales bacterium]